MVKSSGLIGFGLAGIKNIITGYNYHYDFLNIHNHAAHSLPNLLEVFAMLKKIPGKVSFYFDAFHKKGMRFNLDWCKDGFCFNYFDLPGFVRV